MLCNKKSYIYIWGVIRNPGKKDLTLSGPLVFQCALNLYKTMRTERGCTFFFFHDSWEEKSNSCCRPTGVQCISTAPNHAYGCFYVWTDRGSDAVNSTLAGESPKIVVDRQGFSPPPHNEGRKEPENGSNSGPSTGPSRILSTQGQKSIL